MRFVIWTESKFYENLKSLRSVIFFYFSDFLMDTVLRLKWVQAEEAEVVVVVDSVTAADATDAIAATTDETIGAAVATTDVVTSEEMIDEEEEIVETTGKKEENHAAIVLDLAVPAVHRFVVAVAVVITNHAIDQIRANVVKGNFILIF
jgi:Ca2+/H+ antiporter